MAERSPRKLAVILHADVVGSTALVQRDEALAHDRIRDTFHRFSGTIESYNGHPLELRGDALLAEFSRASDAVEASLAFQAENTRFNSTLEDDIQPTLRIGISLGEVVVADNTVTGEGIVLAQRLEQLASAGGVCIQGAVHEAVPGRLPFEYESLGEQELKGFSEPVRAYAVSLKSGEAIPPPELREQPRRQWIVGGAVAFIVIVAGALTWWQPWKPEIEPASVERMPFALPDKPSVAVLPFENMSDDRSQRYFSDGLTEDIITDLARLSGLLVIARNSSFAYRDQAINMQQIGRELGVRYLVEGSVRRADNRIRVTAQLIDVESGMHVWADRYDRDLKDLFVLQDELTRTIVDALAVNLTEQEAEALARSSDTNFDAYDVLLRGNELLARYSLDANAEARELYLKAIALNPRYARAHANLALTYAQDAVFRWTDDQTESIRLGLAAAEEARRLDDRIPQLYFSLSLLYRLEQRWEEATRAARRALELEPNYADGAGILASALTFIGDLDGATAAIEKAKRLNPRYSNIVLQVEGRILYLLGQYEEAAQRLEEAVQRNPGFHQTHVMLAATYGQLGRIEEAEWEVDEVLSLQPEFTISTHVQALKFRDPGLATRYAEGLHKAGMPE